MNTLRTINREESAFLQTLRRIMNQTTFNPNRTGVLTKRIFSPPELRFSLEHNVFPLLTTRRLPLRHIFEELMWFLRGETDVRLLQARGVGVWNENSNRKFLDANGFSGMPEWSIGKSYGYQFRNGVDQLSRTIHLLKTDPYSRRIIINLWNPEDLSEMVLPPCLFCYQFYVSSDGYLSCKATQRSSDIALAGGWNIATISLLTIMLAHVCDLRPKEIVWSVCDAHIYANQFKAVQEQLSRSPTYFPYLYLRKCPPINITKFEWNHFKLESYNPHPPIQIDFNA
jgi:thymidylate synthase